MAICFFRVIRGEVLIPDADPTHTIETCASLILIPSVIGLAVAAKIEAEWCPQSTCYEHRGEPMDEKALLERITANPKIFGGKPIIRGHRLAVEHVLGMLAAGDSAETIREGYSWLETEDIQACLLYARRLVGHERIEPLLIES